MASMSMCDVCGTVVQHTDAKFIKLMKEKPTGAVGAVIVTIEVCSDCYKKVTELLKIPAEYLSETDYKALGEKSV